MKMMKTVKMKKLMMNLMKMVMMNLMEIDVQSDGHLSSYHTLNQVLENKQGIYVFVDAATYDVSNNLDDEDLDE